MRVSGFAVAALMLATASQASAQRIADWPVRVSASPEAITPGLAGLFWNPAAIETAFYPRAVMILDQHTPDVLGINGLAGAGAWRVERTTFGFALQHVGIDDIAWTDTSPVDTLGGFSVSETEFTVAAAHALSPSLSIGAGARYTVVDFDGDADNEIAIGVGALLRPPLPLFPLIGAFVENRGDEIRWGAAAEVRRPLAWPDYQVRVQYGIADDVSVVGIDHRIGAALDWRRTASVGASVARAREADGAAWMPLLAASLHLHRYTLGVVRESLANDFGSAYSFRLQVGF